MKAKLRSGISGWTYIPWRMSFYPAGLPQRRELEYASRAVRTIEINGTFYSLQRGSSFRKWRDSVPDDFVFAVKGSRFITHIRRLREIDQPLANFFASGVLHLGRKQGPFLWQFPPSFRYDPELLGSFFKLLPRSTKEAARLARKHDGRLPERAVMKAPEDLPLRHAIEVRHSSFESEEFIALLRKHDVAMVVADAAAKWPLIEDVTSDFVYVRLHGHDKLYSSGYTRRALDAWEKKVRCWLKGGTPREARCLAKALSPRKYGRDVFVYFDNDVKVHAPFNAAELARRFGDEPRVLEGYLPIAPGLSASAVA
ncbi:DUF72 domain-containing protein [Luteolibacter sp. GHJ8]|uniref:DUF72 domain-containing protein n=1 Tax=Luteolibacter rhizosphaerae TaxID=2989719 RepID=A0ABT3G0D7_9BACT|nr:DUF72 domain-containing protein [Luteolibacter rhizosphaerae]MCW1912944.1 DUF72 domain-containing protein [Luteolibacter rhizosphaerae]